ncbi:hypothetical protein MRB53_030535 [Persea americana]|uniref:Uncharacterized protein n=1 Tax=Persea americana TaxID=3435 RepID=A0ACC2KLL7_PERAE|nr:hypothetical protein MRB53_030535 [Persea americana]
MIPHAFSLLEPCSNNAAEYQALIIGLKLALESGITMLEAFGDSQLIINQMNQKYEIRKPPIGDWRDPFIDYIMFGILPEEPKERISIQRRAPNFHLDIPSKMLYRKSFNGVLLRCLSQQEAEKTLTRCNLLNVANNAKFMEIISTCLEALQSVELYQARMAGSFDKKVRQRAHKKGDLVFAVKRPMVFAHKSKGKFEPKWEGPFVIDKVFSNVAYALLNMEGHRCMLPINGKFLKRYYS